MANYESKYTGAEIDGQLDKVTSLDTEMSKKVNKTTTINGKALSGNITITKGDIGLGNVDNTSDLNKPISTATQTAIDEEITARELGTNEYNVSILYPTSGVTSSGASGGNLYSLETASAIVGTDIKKGQVLAFYDKDNNGATAKYEYNGTSYEEVGVKQDDLYQIGADGTKIPQSFIDLWDAACKNYGSWNSDTKYFELNDLTDITYQQALIIYTTYQNPLLGSSSNYSYKGRTTIPVSRYMSEVVTLKQSLRECPNLETVKLFLASFISISSWSIPFYNCKKLEVIKDIFYMGYSTDSTITDISTVDIPVKTLFLKSVKVDVSMKYLPSLSKESLVYLLTNRANTTSKTITITLHATAYANLSTDSEIIALLPATETKGAATLASV